MRSINLLVFAFILLVSGCASAPRGAPTIACEAIEVSVPIPVKVQPDPSLLVTLEVPALTVIAPTSPAASSCITADGEQQLLDFVDVCVTRVRALRRWADEPLP